MKLNLKSTMNAAVAYSRLNLLLKASMMRAEIKAAAKQRARLMKMNSIVHKYSISVAQIGGETREVGATPPFSSQQPEFRFKKLLYSKLIVLYHIYNNCS